MKRNRLSHVHGNGDVYINNIIINNTYIVYMCIYGVYINPLWLSFSAPPCIVCFVNRCWWVATAMGCASSTYRRHLWSETSRTSTRITSTSAGTLRLFPSCRYVWAGEKRHIVFMKICIYSPSNVLIKIKYKPVISCLYRSANHPLIYDFHTCWTNIELTSDKYSGVN